MSDKLLDLITIGESLVEFSTNQKLENAECLHKYYGGDSLVTAIAAKRLNSKVGFITALGNDPFKGFLLNCWEKEGLNLDHLKHVDGKNGLYMVSRAENEEKEFIYYRNKIAPAKLSIDDISEEYIKNAKIVYASGITQSLSLQAREAVKKAFTIAKDNNILTAYDPNYSSLISTKEDAREYFDEIIELTDILFMSSKYDTKSIFDIDSLENIIKAITDYGVQTVVIKSSMDKGYFVNNNQRNTVFVPFYTDHVIDTTSSGDAFNGAFLHATAEAYSPAEAAKIASIAAGIQAQGIGAVKSLPYYDEVYKIYKSEE